MSHASATHPSAEQRQSLIRVVLDLADDLGYTCAVSLVDAEGRLLSAERPPDLPSADLDRAVGAARGALAGDAAAERGAAGLTLIDGGHVLGAIGVAGGPDGFASEAATAAVHAVRLAASPATRVA